MCECFAFHKIFYNLLKGKVLSAWLLCCPASCFFCASADHFEGTWREERQAKCGTGVVGPGGARGRVFTLCRWSCTRACFPRGWGCDSLESSENSDVTILLSSLIYSKSYILVLLFVHHRKWSECAQRCVPLPSQSELPLQHHTCLPGLPCQLRHRESHGFKRHHQDPQPTFQRVSLNVECRMSTGADVFEESLVLKRQMPVPLDDYRAPAVRSKLWKLTAVVAQ